MTPADLSDSSGAPTTQRVLRKYVASFYSIYGTIAKARMAFVLIIGAPMYAELESPAVIFFTAGHFLASLFTLLMPRWTRQSPISETDRWAGTVKWISISAGVADGIATWILVPAGNVPLAAVIMVVMTANCARAVQSLWAFKTALIAHVSIVMLSLATALIGSGGRYYIFLAIFTKNTISRRRRELDISRLDAGVVNDEADIRDAMRALLGTWSIEVTTVADEAEALHAMARARPGPPMTLSTC